VREEDFRWEEYQDFFDVITAWHVVEHVGNPRRLLSLFYGVLKTQGILVLSVPNKDYVPLSRLLLNREYPLHSRYPRLLPGKEIHLSHFDMDTVLKLLEATHFRIIELGIDYHYAAPNWRAFSKYWLYNALLKISGLNYSETVFAVARKPPSDPQTL
jgi:2-polyprenyl-3-methyl-5-hydroxy-6-metoxy-1,4-benzoquinol methylase